MNSLNFMQSKQTKKLTVTLMKQNKSLWAAFAVRDSYSKSIRTLCTSIAKTKHSNCHVSPNKLRYILKTALTWSHHCVNTLVGTYHRWNSFLSTWILRVAMLQGLGIHIMPEHKQVELNLWSSIIPSSHIAILSSKDIKPGLELASLWMEVCLDIFVQNKDFIFIMKIFSGRQFFP